MTTNQAILLFAAFRETLPTQPRRGDYIGDISALRLRGLVYWSDDDAGYRCTPRGLEAVHRMLNVADKDV